MASSRSLGVLFSLLAAILIAGCGEDSGAAPPLQASASSSVGCKSGQGYQHTTLAYLTTAVRSTANSFSAGTLHIADSLVAGTTLSMDNLVAGDSFDAQLSVDRSAVDRLGQPRDGEVELRVVDREARHERARLGAAAPLGEEDVAL